MFNSRIYLVGKRKYLGGWLVLLFVSIICVAFSVTDNNDFDFARREVLLRQIGHEILLRSGDSTSRVLPIKKISENEYQIRFEKDFTFQPQFLVSTTQRLLAKDPLSTDYVVNVLNCANSSVAYGYAISKNIKDDIVTCIGRKQPVACYIIDIKFKPTGTATAKTGYLLGSLPFLALAGFLFFRFIKKPKKVLPESEDTIQETIQETIQDTGVFSLGSVLFDAGNRKLTINGQTTDLTATETRVLGIFAASPNETVERSRLQKEIWEDEGVIVGRSLDMFISKLRKKLELDPNVKIAVVRGKGYKLEVSA